MKFFGTKLFRYGWKISLLILVLGAGLALFLFYAGWAATFDIATRVLLSGEV